MSGINGPIDRENSTGLRPKPPRDCGDDMRLLFGCEGMPGLDLVPLRQTTSAAGRCGVLGDEYRVSAHRRLFAVVARRRGRESPHDELPRVIQHQSRPLRDEIRALLRSQHEPLTKARSRQRSKDVIKTAH